MSKYSRDREWSDRFIPEIKRIVGPFLLEAAPFELDAKEATDLIVFNVKDMRIAARMRKRGFAERYMYDFTIRLERDTGAETELSKIRKGFGDWLFYGHEDAERDWKVGLWWLIDLAAFRATLRYNENLGGINLAAERKDNHDGTYFMVYDIRSFLINLPIVIGGRDKDSLAHATDEFWRLRK